MKKKNNKNIIDKVRKKVLSENTKEDGFKENNYLEKTELIEVSNDSKENKTSDKVIDKGSKSIKLFFALGIGLLLGLFLVLFFVFFRCSIRFIYEKSSYDIDVFSVFDNPIVTACYGNKFKCKSIDVSIDSDVDTSNIGDYRIVYSAKYKGKSKDFIVNVSVNDNEAPIIDVSKESLSVCPNATLFDVDYKAYDNYDGDITSSVSQSVIDNVLTLSVSDSSNNLSSKDIKLVREDLEAPSISINGNSTMYLPIGSGYSDAGASATDICDGDVSSSISVSGGVDTSRAGSYSVTYSVSDLSGNSTSVSRNVFVYAPNGNGDRVVYLTFDDGPSSYTGELLDILAKYNVKATFFVTNRNPNYVHFIKRAHDEGHTIALHTSTLNYSQVYSSVDAYFNDLNAINETVKNMTGSYSYLIRFPGGSSNTVSRNYSIGIMSTLSRMVTERGYKYFDWNVSSGDADGRNHPSSDYSNNIINGISGRSMSIVLQHDTNINSIRAVSSVIEYGLSHGYSFKALDMSSPVVHHGIAN